MSSGNVLNFDLESNGNLLIYKLPIVHRCFIPLFTEYLLIKKLRHFVCINRVCSLITTSDASMSS